MAAISTITIRDFIKTAKYTHPKQTILIRGRHGIGKSEVVHQLAKEWGLPVVERRIAQLCEADMIGLPDRVATKSDRDGIEHRVTQFLPTDWFLQAMLEPCVVFLDEINRGTPEVQQACFQFVEKGELNGRKIHPDSRIIAAVNFSREYNVTPMGPAFLNRFSIYDLEPDKKDWIDWAQRERILGPDATPELKKLCEICPTNVHPSIVDFIRQCNEDHFEVMPEKAAQLDMHEITPSRRSWARLSNHLVFPPGNLKPLIDRPDASEFYHLARSFVGPDAARALMKFIKQEGKNVTPESILNSFPKVKDTVAKMTPEQLVALIDKLETTFKQLKKPMTDKQAKNVGDFMKTIPSEIAMTIWQKIATADIQNTVSLYKHVARYMLTIIAESESGEQLTQLHQTLEKLKEKDSK